MPFDSQGKFTRVHNWEQDRLNDIDIVSDHADEEDDNFASGFNETFLRDGRVAMQGDINMGGHRIKNVGNALLSGDVVTKNQVDSMSSRVGSNVVSIINALQPVGDIKASAQSANHGNWLLCDGQEVERESYPELYNLIGTKFGAGNGVTTFNVPDYRGKFLRGLGGNSATDIQTTQAESLPAVPSHYHLLAGAKAGGSDSVNIDANNYLCQEGGASGTHAVAYRLNGSSTTPTKGRTSSVSVSSGLYNGSHVTPINQAVYFFIKAKSEVLSA